MPMSLLDRFRSARAKRCPDCGTELPAVARFCFLCGRPLATGEQAGSAPPPPADLRDRLARALDGRYEVRELLGAGGMGAVYLADDLALERPVAIKVLPPELSADRSVVQRFQREAKTAAKLDHPHIIPIHRVESEDGLHYIVMKLVPGRSLEAVLATGARVPLPFALRVLREAASALGHAHRHGVVHRDVKPANIMLDADDRVVLTDFGISKASRDGRASTQLTQSGAVIGTPHYMAPEQALGHPVDGRADQYALAVVGFQMLTGTLPFDGESPHAIIHRHINHAAPRVTPLRPDAPAAVGLTIARALSKAPSHRFASMEEFVAALDGEAQPGAPTIASRGGSAATTTPVGRRSGAAAAVATSPTTAAELLGDGTTRRITVHGRARRRLLWVASLTALLAGIGGVLGATGGLRRMARGDAASRDSLSLSVSSAPSATVYVDGARIGQTPIVDHRLPAGRRHELRVERKGYRTRRDTIAAGGSGPIVRGYTLERASRR